MLLGYCAYYSVFFIAKELPNQLEIAEGHFDDLIVSNSAIQCIS